MHRYGTAELIGREYTDEVCILFGYCVKDFPFFYIEEQEGLREPIDGILGLAREYPFILAPEEETKTGVNYIKALAEADIIPANEFAFYFNPPEWLSWIDLGPAQEKHFRNDTTVMELQMNEEDFFWSGYC